MKRCDECGSWGVQCEGDKPYPGCGCARCANHALKLAEKKVKKYESLMHSIQMYAEVVMNNERVGQLIRNICDWSYAHRVGNGMLSEEEQNRAIRNAFDKLDVVK